MFHLDEPKTELHRQNFRNLVRVFLLAVLVGAVAELAAYGPGNSQAGVNVGEELLGVLLDLANGEALAGVGLSSGGVDTGEEGSGEAADAAADVGGALNGLGVGESNAALGSVSSRFLV